MKIILQNKELPEELSNKERFAFLSNLSTLTGENETVVLKSIIDTLMDHKPTTIDVDGNGDKDAIAALVKLGVEVHTTSYAMSDRLIELAKEALDNRDYDVATQLMNVLKQL